MTGSAWFQKCQRNYWQSRYLARCGENKKKNVKSDPHFHSHSQLITGQKFLCSEVIGERKKNVILNSNSTGDLQFPVNNITPTKKISISNVHLFSAPIRSEVDDISLFIINFEDLTNPSLGESTSTDEPAEPLKLSRCKWIPIVLNEICFSLHHRSPV